MLERKSYGIEAVNDLVLPVRHCPLIFLDRSEIENVVDEFVAIGGLWQSFEAIEEPKVFISFANLIGNERGRSPLGNAKLTNYAFKVKDVVQVRDQVESFG